MGELQETSDTGSMHSNGCKSLRVSDVCDAGYRVLFSPEKQKVSPLRLRVFARKIQSKKGFRKSLYRDPDAF